MWFGRELNPGLQITSRMPQETKRCYAIFTIFFLAVFAKFSTFANLYWLLVVSLLVLLANVTKTGFLTMFAKSLTPFANLCRIPYCLVLCLVCKIFSSRYIRQVSLIPQLLWQPNCFMLCPVGQCGKIVFLGILSTLANLYGPPLVV